MGQEKERHFTATLGFRVGDGCDFFEPDVLGGYARCHVAAADEAAAKAKIEAQLTADHLALVEFLWCVANDEVDWDPPLRQEDLRNIARAESTGEVVWSSFDVYETDASDIARG